MNGTRLQFGSCMAIIATILLSAMSICFAQPQTAVAHHHCCPGKSAPANEASVPQCCMVSALPADSEWSAPAIQQMAVVAPGDLLEQTVPPRLTEDPAGLRAHFPPGDISILHHQLLI